MTSRIEKARVFARQAHDSIGQRRKYSDEPYWKHTERVAARVEFFKGSEEMIIAALNHDVIEDVSPEAPGFGLHDILKYFGPIVAKYVIDLTNVFTKASFPAANRKTRHKWEAQRLSLVSDEVKIVKLSDRLDNVLTIPMDGFGKLYAEETRELVEAVRVTSGKWKRASDMLVEEIYDTIK